MKALFIIGIITALLDAAAVVDLPNWISAVLIGVPVAFWAVVVGLVALVAAYK